MPSGTQITIPTFPSPKTIEPAFNDIVAATVSVYTGDQQIMNWGVGPCTISVSMPPMLQSVAGPWISFLQSLQGIANYFTFSDAMLAAYPEILMNGSNPRYWRLTSNVRPYQVPNDRFYRISFDCREAL